MKKIVVGVVIVLLLSVGFCFAGEVEELKLKKQNLELTLQNIQFQFQFLQQQFAEAQKQLKEVDEKLKIKDPRFAEELSTEDQDNETLYNSKDVTIED